MLSNEPKLHEACGAQPSENRPANDNAIGSLASPAPDRHAAERRYRLAVFPPGTSMLITRRERPANQIGRGRHDEWLLRFDPQSRLFADPLTGWTGGSDPLRHVELGFATLEQAIRYAERHALPYRINGALLGQPTHSTVKEALHEQAA